MAEDNTPTNVVDEGIELYHSRSKGIDTPRDFHAGTYQAAIDRSAFMFGDTNMYQLIKNTQELAQEQVNDMLSEIVSDSTGKFEDGKYLEREILVDLPNGNQQPVNVLVETIDDTGGYKVMILDKDNFGFTIYSEDGFGESPANKSLLEVNGNAVLVGEADDTFGYVAGFKPENKTFNYKDGYELYKVEIKPNSNVVTFTGNIELVENGVKQNIDPDLFVNYLEMNLLTDIDSITLPDGKTIDLQGLSDTEKRNKLKNNIDVIGYRNQMEDVGSTSYYFLNNDAYTETLVDNATNAKFDNDVLKKFIDTNPNVGITDFKRASDKRLNIVTDLLSSKPDTPTNVVDDTPTLNTDLVWENDALERRNIGDKNPSWADNVISQNNILKPNLKFEDLRKIVPQIIDGTVSDVDFTRFGIWLMSKSPEIAFGTKSFNSPDALADITKIVIFNGKNPSDLINKNTLEIIKNEIGYKEGSRVIDYVPPDNRLSNAFKLEPQKSLVGLSDNLILQFGAEEGPFTNAQQRMKQTIINEHNKLYKNADDYFILFRGGELTDDPMQSFSKSGERSYNIALHFDKNLTDKGVDAYYVNKNDFIDLHSLGLDYDNEKELIVYKEAVENPYSKTVMKEGQTVNFLDKGRVKFLQDNWISISDEFPKKGFILPDTPGGSLGAAKLNDPLVFDSWIDNYANTTTSFVDNLPLSTTVKNQFNNLVQGRARNLATPGGVADAVDVWELGVLGLMIAAVAYKEYDEIPTILTNKAVDMFNSMTSSYGIPPVPKEQYDLDYEFINKVVETGEKFMPTDIIIKKVVDVVKGAAETGAVTGFGYVPPNLTKTDTMETTQKIQPGVQEEKMFKKAKPQKGSGAGSGVKIL